MPKMTKTGVYMNRTTRAIQRKGYTIAEFCELYCISLRTYRRRESNEHSKHTEMLEFINNLESKNG